MVVETQGSEDLAESIFGASSHFSKEQIAQLNARLDRKLLKKNPQGQVYIEAYVAIEHLNRIFGFGGWSFAINQIESETDDEDGVLYFARCTLTAHAPDGTQTHHDDEGSSIAPKSKKTGRVSFQSRETARKGSISDCIKRCARHFGNQFGNALYDKDYMQNDQAADRVEQDENAKKARYSEEVIKREKEKVDPAEVAVVREGFRKDNGYQPAPMLTTWTSGELVAYGRFLGGLKPREAATSGAT